MPSLVKIGEEDVTKRTCADETKQEKKECFRAAASPTR